MLGLVKAWWAAKEGLESAAEAKRSDVDWSKKNFPFFAPLMHVESDELKNNKEKGILVTCKFALFFTVAYYAVLFAAHFYEFGKDSFHVVELAVTGLHAIGGSILSFYIVYRAFRAMALGPDASFIYKLAESGLTVFMFLMMFNSLLYVHGIKFVFQEVKKPDKDMTLIYFAAAEIGLCVIAVILRLICLLSILD